MDKRLNVGIIGYGGMGRGHFWDVGKTDCMKVRGAYDLTPSRQQLIREDGIICYDSQQQMLDDPNIDLVIIATPNNFHKDIAIACFEAGKHVLCEKPVALSARETEDMIASAKAHNKVFTVHQNRRWDLDYLMVKEAMATGFLGNLFSIESRVHGSRGIPNGWRQYKIAGGGMMLDWGVHLIDQLMMLIQDQVTSVYCKLYNVNYQECDDYFKLILTFHQGQTATIEVGTCNFITLPRWYVAGDKGTFVIQDWNCENALTYAKDVETDWEEDIIYTKAGPTKTMAPRPKGTTETITIAEPQPDKLQRYQNIAAAICGTEELLVKPEQSLRVIQVMEAAFQSSESGQAIHTLI